MAECATCKAEIAVYDRRCRTCGAGVLRAANRLLSGAPTDKELSRARLVHLLALPGMLVLVLAYPLTADTIGLWALAPLNLLIPFVYWLLHLKSRFVRSHGAEVVNFQLPWTLTIYVAWLLLGHTVLFGIESIGASLALLLLVIGSGLVWLASIDAANAEAVKYIVRIPIFR